MKVGREVIDHLSHQSGPVDRIDGADPVAPLEVGIAGHGFDDVLAIVEHPLDGEVVDVVVLQAEHLGLLKGAHAPMRRHHEDANALLAAHRIFRRAAGVATGCAEDVQLLTPARQLVFEQIAEQLHGHVLERQRGAVRQFRDVKTRLKLPHRRDPVRCQRSRRVGLRANRLQVGGRNIVDVERQDFEGEVG